MNTNGSEREPPMNANEHEWIRKGAANERE